MFVFMHDRFSRQKLRTKLILGVVPVLAITSCTFWLPQDPYFDLDIGRMSHMVRSNVPCFPYTVHTTVFLLTHLPILQLGTHNRIPFALGHLRAAPPVSTFASPEDCLETGSWRGLSLKDERYQHSPLLRAAATSVTLPLTSDLLYFLSQGDHNAGTIEIVEGGEKGSKEVRVDVQMYYSSQEVLQTAKVCRMQAARGKNGVGIFVRCNASCGDIR